MRRPEIETGFTAPAARPLGQERRTVALAQAMATLALALGTAIAATVVGAGIAHAEIVRSLAPRDASFFAVALIVSAIVAVVAVIGRARGAGHL
jgi:uncharacterized membrane protein